jgi:hypothetical protein
MALIENRTFAELEVSNSLVCRLTNKDIDLFAARM